MYFLYSTRHPMFGRTMAQCKSNDSDWPEVSYINDHARFIGLLRMGVRGLSVLVFTWATAVLLGGFVSDLEEKDFWCLTAITFVQIFSSGIFDFLLNGKSSFSKNSWRTLRDTVSPMAVDIFHSIKKRRKRVHVRTTPFYYFVWLTQLLMVVFVLCPLVAFYLSGLYISTGIALWRLIKHDYGDVKRNQQPALIVLYSLAVGQGWFHGFKTLYARVNEGGLVKEVVDFYLTSMHDDEDQQVLHSLVSDYRDKTMMGCTKDPIMFTTERNLVTYAVELMMECNSSDSYLSGVRILGAILQKHYFRDGTVDGQADWIKKKLTESASFGNVVRRLIETMGTGVEPDGIKIREHAARIVAHVADSINLWYSSKGREFLSFLVRAVEEYYRGLSGKHSPEQSRRRQHSRAKGRQIKRIRVRLPERQQQQETLDPTSEWLESGSHWLVVHGLRIITSLADNEDNRRMIIDIEDVISKISSPLRSEQLHEDDHDKWSSIAELSLKLMTRFMDDTGESGRKFETIILGKHKEIVITILQKIMDCPKCELSVKIQAVEVFLLHLSDDDTPPYVMASGSNSSSTFTWILLVVFLRKGSGDDTGELAGENLSAMLPLRIEGSDTIMLQSVRAVVGHLTRALMDPESRHLIDQTKDDGYLKLLKNAMLYVMPKVLKEILGYGSPREVKSVGLPGNGQSSLQDIESGPVTKGNAHGSSSLSHQQISEQLEGRKLQEALISLCQVIRDEWYYKDDPTVTHQLDEIAEKICTEQGKRPKPFSSLVARAAKLSERTKQKDRLVHEQIASG